MTFDIDRAKYIGTGLVNEHAHPSLPLLIYNYTPKCQFSRAWDDVTMMCRGLIVHKDTREIIARPFRKFFNYEEHMALGMSFPNETPTIYKKLDGSLGILYYWNDQPHIATRGSFISDQATWATEWFRANLPDFTEAKGFTFLFEIIYPANRIVVNYNFSGLVLLGVTDTESGRSAMSFGVTKPPLKGPETIPYASYTELKALNTPNEEGFVAHFPRADLRVKIKFDDYVKLHKVMTGLSEIGIWEMLRDGKNPITEEIPDEMHDWISGVVERLSEKFKSVEDEAWATMTEALKITASDKKEERKVRAEIVTKSKHPRIAFSMLDKKDHAMGIWRMIRPHGLHTFRNDIDA